jgi:adenine-specific DNA-methyltransferase
MSKEYEPAKRIEEFVEIHQRVLPEIIRVTAKGGSICWQVGYCVRDSSVIPLDYIVHDLMMEHIELTLRNRIIWTYGHGLHCLNRFSGRHEVILWYTKGDDFTFDLDAVRIPQKYPGKRHYRGPRKGQLSGHALGKNPSDVWDIPNVKANHIEKTDHPCQFPVALALRLIRALTKPNAVVLDPFLGAGSTAVAAINAGRRFWGSELVARYHSIAEKRCKAALRGRAKIRPPELSVAKPNQKDAVARMPLEFQAARKAYELPLTIWEPSEGRNGSRN